MRYIVITYNYLTLSKAVMYAKKLWGIDKTQIIYLPHISDFYDSEVFNQFNIIRVEPRKSRCLFKFILDAEKRILEAKAVVATINYLMKKNGLEDCSFVVFKDFEIRECLIINHLKAKYKNAKFVLMEEGIGMYANPPHNKKSFKRWVHSGLLFVYGAPKYFIENHPMGCNPAIDRIICSNPDALRKRGFSKDAIIEKEINVFSKENCEYLLKNLFKIELGGCAFDYVFLTQPVYLNSTMGHEKYDRFLKELFAILKQKGSVLIKKHPRDKWNYEPYKDNNVDVCGDEINHIPFECLMGAYGNPQMMTLFSSAACNPLTNKKSVFLYKLLPESVGGCQIDNILDNSANVVICDNFSDLTKILES